MNKNIIKIWVVLFTETTHRRILSILLFSLFLFSEVHANIELYEQESLQVQIKDGNWLVSGSQELKIVPDATVISTKLFPEDYGHIAVVEPYDPLMLTFKTDGFSRIDSLELEMIELTRAGDGKIVLLYQGERKEIDRPVDFQLLKHNVTFEGELKRGKQSLTIGTLDGRFGIRSIVINVSTPLTPNEEDPRWATTDGSELLVEILTTDLNIDRRRLAAKILASKSGNHLSQSGFSRLVSLFPDIKDPSLLTSLLELFISTESQFTPQVEQHLLNRLSGLTEPQSLAAFLKFLRSTGSRHSNTVEDHIAVLYKSGDDSERGRIIRSLSLAKDVLSSQFIELLSSELHIERRYHFDLLNLIANASSEGAKGATTAIVSLYDQYKKKDRGWGDDLEPPDSTLGKMVVALFAIDPNLSDKNAQKVVLNALLRKKKYSWSNDHPRELLIKRVLERKERRVQWSDELLSALIDSTSEYFIAQGGWGDIARKELQSRDKRIYNLLARLDYKGNKFLELFGEIEDVSEANIDPLARELITPPQKRHFVELMFFKALYVDPLPNVKYIAILAKPFYQEISAKYWLPIYKSLFQNWKRLDSSELLLIYEALSLIPPPANTIQVQDVEPLLATEQEIRLSLQDELGKKRNKVENLAINWLALHSSWEIDIELGRLILESKTLKSYALDLILSQSRKGGVKALVIAAGDETIYDGLSNPDELLRSAREIAPNKKQHVDLLLGTAKGLTEGLRSFPFYLSVSKLDPSNIDAYNAAISWWKTYPHERLAVENAKEVLANLDAVFLMEQDQATESAYKHIVEGWKAWRDEKGMGYTCSLLDKNRYGYGDVRGEVVVPESDCNLARFDTQIFKECLKSRHFIGCEMPAYKEVETYKSVHLRSKMGFGYTHCEGEILVDALSIVKRYPETPGDWAINLIIEKSEQLGLASHVSQTVEQIKNRYSDRHYDRPWELPTEVCREADLKFWRELIEAAASWTGVPKEIVAESLRYQSVSVSEEDQLEEQTKGLLRALDISSALDTAVLCNYTKSLVTLKDLLSVAELERFNNDLKARLKKTIEMVSDWSPEEDRRWGVDGEVWSKDLRGSWDGILEQKGKCNLGTDEQSLKATIWKYLAEQGDEEAFRTQMGRCCTSWHVAQLGNFGSNLGWAKRIITWVLLNKVESEPEYEKTVSWFTASGLGGDVSLLNDWISEEESKPASKREPRLIRGFYKFRSIVTSIFNEGRQ
jgi:hypothetical protein